MSQLAAAVRSYFANGPMPENIANALAELSASIPWSDLEGVVQVAEVAYTSEYDEPPEKGSSIQIVRQWLDQHGLRTAPEPSERERIAEAMARCRHGVAAYETYATDYALADAALAALAGPPPAGDLDAACDRLISLVGNIAALDPSKRRVAHMDIDRLRAALHGGSHQPDPIEVVAGVRMALGKLWIVQRGSDGAHGGLAGLWEYPGGKVEPGETLANALWREWREEFGVDISIGRCIDTIETETEGKLYRVRFFEVITHSDPLLKIHIDSRWVYPDHLAAYHHLPSGTEFNRRLTTYGRCLK